MNFEDTRSISQDLTFETAERFFKERGISFTETDKISMHFMNDGLYTNLAYILSDQCPFGTKTAVYNGSGVRSFIDRKEFSGSILKQAEDIYEYLRMHNPQSSTFDGLFRTDLWAVDPVAIREAVLNALVHRSYSVSDGNLIRIYPDRFEITSLGGLPSGVK